MRIKLNYCKNSLMEPRLKENEINELIVLHKSLKKKNDADKIKCLIYWGKGWSWKEIKEALNNFQKGGSENKC